MGQKQLKRVGWDVLMGTVVGTLTGIAAALFLWLLETVIHWREHHGWLLFCLPLLGMASAALYDRYGQGCEGGAKLIFAEARCYHGKMPARMGWLVLVGTLLTHLGGGSAGREGTAVQMGASLARMVGKLPWPWLRLTRYRQRLLLMAGASAGFGALFGTPFAGALFGVEVVNRGKLRMEGLLLCGVASAVGDGVCRFLGSSHRAFSPPALPMTLVLLLKLALFALPIVLMASAFVKGTDALAHWTKRWLPEARWRVFTGGCAIIGLTLLLGTPDYLNLGTCWFPRVLEGSGTVPPWAFAWKALFTVITLGFGFKGGEVTPLFAMGALLGAALAPVLGLPTSYLGAVGFVALFAAASHTPIAGLALGAELFGSAYLLPLMVVNGLSRGMAGNRSIYTKCG